MSPTDQRRNRPRILSIEPRAAISGGEIAVRGDGFVANGRARPVVRLGETPASLLISSPTRLIVRIPDGVVSGELTVDSGSAVSDPSSVAVGRTITDNLHPVANPAIDPDGNIFSTFSGSRGQKVAVSVFRITRRGNLQPFVNDLMNPTGLAFGRDGYLYISSRAEGSIYKISARGERTVFAEGMGVATGLAFDREGHLYVGDRTGTIFKINPEGQIFVFATVEPSVAAYHLAFGPDGDLFVTGPTTSSYDHVYRVSPSGEAKSFFRGLGRPQGLAFDAAWNLYVAASLAGRRGVVRLTTKAEPELAISGSGIVGLAFTPDRSVILATTNSLIELPINVAGMPLI
ncbi:MAG: SMP-30/gluconolactonase/LRE family protein [Acidobacteria bacterium]|nr:SMP-30/gluconolactonase/LRE family protein [Acidobacteriota bacterium]